MRIISESCVTLKTRFSILVMVFPYKLVFGAFLIVSLFFTAVAGVHASEIGINSCGILNESNTRYIMSGDIAAAVPECIVIEGENIELEGNFHMLNGEGHSFSQGIYVKNSENVTISNLRVNLFGTAIRIENSSGIVVREQYIIDSPNGFALYNVINSAIVNSSFVQELLPSEGGSVIHLEDSSNNRIEDIFSNQISFEFADGYVGSYLIYSMHSNNNSYSNMNSNLSLGITLEDSSSNLFSYIYAGEVVGNGVYLYGGSNYNKFQTLLLPNATARGIYLEGISDYNEFNNSIISDSMWQGILIRTGKHNKFFNGSIIGSASIALTIGIEANNNSFEQFHIGNTEDGEDVQIYGNSLDNVFVDSYFDNYNILDSTIIVKDSRFGQARVIGIVTASGNISETFGFGQNEFRLNMSEGMRGHYFDVMLFGIPADRTNYRMMRNGVTCDPAICNAEGPLNTGDVVFMVYDDGTYSIASDALPEPPAPAPENSGNSGGGGSGRSRSPAINNSPITNPVQNLANNQSSNNMAIPVNESSTEEIVNIESDNSPSRFRSITGAAIGLVRKPGFWVPAVFILGVIGAFFLVRAKMKNKIQIQ